MRTAELIASIARACGYLRVTTDGGIDYVGPPAVLSDAMRDEIRRNKSTIVAWLRTPLDKQPRVDQLTLDYQPTLDEHTRARLFDDSIPDALHVLELCRRASAQTHSTAPAPSPQGEFFS